jgi:hypothetical protein
MLDLRNSIFWAVTQHEVVIPYRRFGTTYRLEITTTRCVIAKKSAVIIYFAVEAWNLKNWGLVSNELEKIW